MNQTEAKELCERYSREHPDRKTHRWVATKQGGEWVVAKIDLPPAPDTTPEVQADEKPPTPDDPRWPPYINPPGAGLG